MLLYPCVYGPKQYGHLNNSCPLCFLFCSVLLFKIIIYHLGPSVPSFGKELIIQFTVRVPPKRLSICGCPSFPFSFEGGVWHLTVLISSHCLSVYFIPKKNRYR